MRAFRHALPVMVNEWLARRGQRKVSTDMAVPDAAFPAMLGFYRERCARASRVRHLRPHRRQPRPRQHPPARPRRAAAARKVYGRFVERAVSLGGTVSAEHGVGKIKREYLRALYGERALREMAELSAPSTRLGVLGRGNVFAEEFLPAQKRERAERSGRRDVKLSAWPQSLGADKHVAPPEGLY